ncbi:MAG: hypothetical protein MI924_19410, partial [Chloroflexales bacterium]|nr:hypothetical protein [Chloroflexales bacterium]
SLFLLVMRSFHATCAQEVAAALNAAAVDRMAAADGSSSDNLQHTVRVESVCIIEQVYRNPNACATVR